MGPVPTASTWRPRGANSVILLNHNCYACRTTHIYSKRRGAPPGSPEIIPLFGADTKGDPVFSMCFPPRQNASLVGLHQKWNCTKIEIFVILHPLSGLNETSWISSVSDAKSLQQAENVVKVF